MAKSVHELEEKCFSLEKRVDQLEDAIRRGSGQTAQTLESLSKFRTEVNEQLVKLVKQTNEAFQKMKAGASVSSYKG